MKHLPGFAVGASGYKHRCRCDGCRDGQRVKIAAQRAARATGQPVAPKTPRATDKPSSQVRASQLSRATKRAVAPAMNDVATVEPSGATEPWSINWYCGGCGWATTLGEEYVDVLLKCPECGQVENLTIRQQAIASGSDAWEPEPQPEPEPAKSWVRPLAGSVGAIGNTWPGTKTINPARQAREPIAALPEPTHTLTADERELINERANMNAILKTLRTNVKAARRYAHVITNGSKLLDVAEQDIEKSVIELAKVTDVTGAPYISGSLTNVRNRVWSERKKPIEALLRRIDAARDELS
jgi:hypothetical protein